MTDFENKVLKAIAEISNEVDAMEKKDFLSEGGLEEYYFFESILTNTKEDLSEGSSKYQAEEFIANHFLDMNIEYKFSENFGGEGNGDSYWVVYEFNSTETDEKCYIRFSGWYASFNGSEFEYSEVVEPEVVQKVIWKKKV